jgi:hypothetical protein
MKNILQKKEEEIEEYKKNIKCAKYSKLEFNYNSNLVSYNKLKTENENIRKLCNEVTEKFIKEKEENEKISNLYIKLKGYSDESKQRLKNIEDENKELIAKCKIMEDRNCIIISNLNPNVSQLNKISLKKHEKIIKGYIKEIENLSENFKKEKIRLEKRINYMDKDYKELKKCYE